MVQTAGNWSDWVGVMVTSHFDLVLGLLWAPRGPKRACFGPKMHFWGPWRSWEGPRGPDSVPTAANWSDWIGVMVTTHFGLVLDLLWAPRAPKRACFGPKRPSWGSSRDSEAPPWARFGPNCRQLVRLGWSHGYHTLCPGIGPPLGPFWGPWRSWEGHRGPDLVPTAANWSDWVGVMVTSHFGLVLGLFLAQGAPKGPVLALNASFGGPGWTRRVPGARFGPTCL